MSEPFDPYRKWLGIPPQDQPPHHYRLLGISPFEDDPDVIDNAANRQMQHIRTFQSGRHAAFSQQILNEISAAKICLLSPEKKADYDKQLKRELKQKRQPVATAAPVRAAAPPIAAPAGGAMDDIAEALPAEDIPQSAAIPNFGASPKRGGPPVAVGAATRTVARGGKRARTGRKSSPWPIVLGMMAVVVIIGLLAIVMNMNSNQAATQPSNAVSSPPPPAFSSSPTPSRQPQPRVQARPTPRTAPTTPLKVDSGGFPVGTLQDSGSGFDPVMGDLSKPADSPFGGTSPTANASNTSLPDSFQIVVEAARDSIAARDYQAAEQYIRQVQQEKRSGNSEHERIAEQLDGVRALLAEFSSAARRALTHRREVAEEHEVFGRKIVLPPYESGVVSYSFDGEQREFDVATFWPSLQGVPVVELAALADIGLHRNKANEEESQIDRNYRRVYVALFLCVDRVNSETREQQLKKAVELYQAAAADGTDHPVLKAELITAGALPNPNTSSSEPSGGEPPSNEASSREASSSQSSDDANADESPATADPPNSTTQRPD
ncbi:MAG: hypothetical protein KDA38_04885 [Planctomycetales bacterium]|nr:hypothetical protein [Planctomycetales bacterium]